MSQPDLYIPSQLDHCNIMQTLKREREEEEEEDGMPIPSSPPYYPTSPSYAPSTPRYYPTTDQAKHQKVKDLSQVLDLTDEDEVRSPQSTTETTQADAQKPNAESPESDLRKLATELHHEIEAQFYTEAKEMTPGRTEEQIKQHVDLSILSFKEKIDSSRPENCRINTLLTAVVGHVELSEAMELCTRCMTYYKHIDDDAAGRIAYLIPSRLLDEFMGQFEGQNFHQVLQAVQWEFAKPGGHYNEEIRDLLDVSTKPKDTLSDHFGIECGFNHIDGKKVPFAKKKPDDPIFARLYAAMDFDRTTLDEVYSKTLYDPLIEIAQSFTSKAE